MRRDAVGYLANKLQRKYIWKRILYERLTEPMHLNLLSLGVLLFGSFRRKVEFDLVVRQQHAYALLKAADRARKIGVETVSVIEFGVAAGAGLINLQTVAARVTAETGIAFRIYGFDTGQGMPAVLDYRDHPDLYRPGDFPSNVAALRARLGPETQLILGNLSDTVAPFLEQLPASEPVGFVAIDVDYYSSTQAALAVFEGPADRYLPATIIYVDDLEDDHHNSWCGELLAIGEFNAAHDRRKIERHAFLANKRLFRNANWIKHMFQLHVLDHPIRTFGRPGKPPVVLDNPYLDQTQRA